MGSGSIVVADDRRRKDSVLSANRFSLTEVTKCNYNLGEYVIYKVCGRNCSGGWCVYILMKNALGKQSSLYFRL
jgi:hypothetical protein